MKFIPLIYDGHRMRYAYRGEPVKIFESRKDAKAFARSIGWPTHTVERLGADSWHGFGLRSPSRDEFIAEEVSK